MRTYLVFHQNGEVSERLCNCKYFDIIKFVKFNNFITYNKYVILYNDNENEEYNITTFTFTEDKYRGEIGLIKVNKDNKVMDLYICDYYDSVLKQKLPPNDLYYSSEEESYEYNFT